MMLCERCGASIRDIMIAQLRAEHPQLPIDDITAVVDFSCAYELTDEDKRAIVDDCKHAPLQRRQLRRPPASRIVDDDCECRWKKRT